MPDLESDIEQQLLRSIRRRRKFLGLAFALPIIVAWLLVSRWIAQRWNLQPDLARFTFVLIFVIIGIFAPRWLGESLNHDLRETPRLRWLNEERADRKIARSRIIVVFILGLLLLIQCAVLLEPKSTNAAFSSADVLIWPVLALSMGLRWRPADLGDEGAQLRYLVAVNRAFLVTLVACLAAIVLDAYRGGGILRPALEAALLIGCLTLQLSLLIGEQQTVSDSE